MREAVISEKAHDSFLWCSDFWAVLAFKTLKCFWADISVTIGCFFLCKCHFCIISCWHIAVISLSVVKGARIGVWTTKAHLKSHLPFFCVQMYIEPYIHRRFSVFSFCCCLQITTTIYLLSCQLLPHGEPRIISWNNRSEWLLHEMAIMVRLSFEC